MVQNSLCICGDTNFSAADLTASQIYKCDACEDRYELSKLDLPQSQKLGCKGIKAERARFVLEGFNSVNSDFSYSNLRNTSWVGNAVLSGSNFHAGDFSGAFFEKFNCNECDFTKVKLHAIKILGFLNLIKSDVDDVAIIEFMESQKIYLTVEDLEKIPNYTESE